MLETHWAICLDSLQWRSRVNNFCIYEIRHHQTSGVYVTLGLHCPWCGDQLTLDLTIWQSWTNGGNTRGCDYGILES